MKKIVTVLILSSLCFLPALAQELKEMEWSEVPETEQKAVIATLPNESLLAVYTTIPDLDFASSPRGVIRVEKSPGFHLVHLEPGTMMITFSAPRYANLMESIFIERKNVRHIRIKAKFSGGGGIDENNPEITLKYTPSSPEEKIRGSLDGAVQRLDFSSGSFVLKPSPGKHTIIITSGNKRWEKSFDLKAGDRISETVQLRDSNILPEVRLPGTLFITSDPPGAQVFLNKGQQSTAVPKDGMTIEDLDPGTYEIELRLPGYLPQVKQVQVVSAQYTQVHFPLVPNFGYLEINSQPPGAMVYIKENQPLGTTPLKRDKFEAGKYFVKLTRIPYHDYIDSLEMKPMGRIVKNYPLAPLFGKVAITSDPPGASIVLDDKAMGTTNMPNALLDTVFAGAHNLKLTLPYYQDYIEQINVIEGQPFSKLIKLAPNFATVSVRSNPTGANFKITGNAQIDGITPMDNIRVYPGGYDLNINLLDYETYTSTLLLTVGDNERIDAPLKRRAGNLDVSTIPQKATIKLDGITKGTSPKVLTEIPTGKYKLTLDKPDYDIIETEVIINHKETTKIRRDLFATGTENWKKQRVKARIFSFLLPSSGQFISGQNARGAIYAGSLLGAVYMAYTSQQSYQDSKTAYELAREGYLTSATQNQIEQKQSAMLIELDNMNKYKDDFNLFTYAIAGVYGLQMLDAFIFGGGKRPVVKASIDSDKIELGMNIDW